MGDILSKSAKNILPVRSMGRWQSEGLTEGMGAASISILCADSTTLRMVPLPKASLQGGY